jgi:PAS domain S-box-containing protein
MGSSGELQAAALGSDAEAKLRAERAFREALENSIPAGMTGMDPDGRQFYVNPTFCRMVGWPQEELLGASIPFIYWPPEEIDAISKAFRAALSGSARPAGFDLRFQRKNGERFDVHVVIAPLNDRDGNVSGWLASVWEVTERKRAERRRAAEHETTRILGSAATLGDAAPAVLESVGSNLDWDAGAFWSINKTSGRLRCAEQWQKPGAGLSDFQAHCAGLEFSKDIGLPGRVWASCRPMWIPDVVYDANFPRARMAARAGLHGAFAFPILLGGEFHGVMEFFAREVRQPDEEVLRTARSLGAQIGQFMERKQAEEALRQSEQRYRTIVETANEGVWLIDREARTAYVNHRLTAMLGYTAEEMIGRTMLEFVFPEELQAARERIRSNLHGRPEQFDFRFRRKDGSELITLCCTSPMWDAEGKIIGALGMFSDVTDRRRAEEAAGRLAAIVECSDDAIISKSLDGTIQSWNSGAERIYGYAAAEVIGTRMLILVPQERGEEEALILQRLQRGERVDHFETVRVRKDGRQIHVSMTVSPILDTSGNITGASHVSRDITERKLFEQQLRETAKLESLGVLAGGVAHDFNNLLVGIMGNASLAMELLPPASQAATMIAGVLQASERAADLTRQLLAYSGKGRFVVQPIDLSALVRQIVSLLQSSVPKTVQLQLELEDEIPPVEADVAQIQQLVMNLVINGAEALGDAPGTVSVRTAARTLGPKEIDASEPEFGLRPGEYVCLQVQDDGCGMDEAVKARIFDPFFTTKFTGRGLGMAAALGIVRGHNGAITVDTAPGRGSTFTVLFPASQGQTVQESAAPPRELTGQGTILVVDDEDIVRRMAGATLERYGYTILLAADGREAIDVFRDAASRVTLVLLDLTMPRMSGEETLRQLKEIRDDIPVVLSSGFSEAEAVRRFTGCGLAGFLQKPYTAERLAGKVRQVAADSRASSGP